MPSSAAASSLPPPVAGQRLDLASPAGRLALWVAGDGPPLLLVHSINAAGSAAEVRPLHEAHAHRRRVVSIDLPGFGHSERSDRAYTPRLMTDAVHAAVAAIQAQFGPGPVDALGASLGCEFLARAAAESPASFRSLALVSPTGVSGTGWRGGAPGSVVGPRWALRLVRGLDRGLGGALFRGLTRPGVIRYFLQRTWGSKQIDEALWRQDVLTTREPGAAHAPLAFLSAQLFSADIGRVYERLTVPVWVSHGVRGDFTDYRGLPRLMARPNWRLTVYPTGALPYFEQPDAFLRDHEAFLNAATPPHPTP